MSTKHFINLSIEYILPSLVKQLIMDSKCILVLLNKNIMTLFGFNFIKDYFWTELLTVPNRCQYCWYWPFNFYSVPMETHLSVCCKFHLLEITVSCLLHAGFLEPIIYMYWHSWSVPNYSMVCDRYFTNKTDHHDITEILLKVVLNTINLDIS